MGKILGCENAKEYWDTWKGAYTPEQIMIEFAKAHVEAALKAAAEKVMVRYTQTYPEGADMQIINYVDKDSILNAYPLKNIQ